MRLIETTVQRGDKCCKQCLYCRAIHPSSAQESMQLRIPRRRCSQLPATSTSSPSHLFRSWLCLRGAAFVMRLVPRRLVFVKLLLAHASAICRAMLPLRRLRNSNRPIALLAFSAGGLQSIAAATRRPAAFRYACYHVLDVSSYKAPSPTVYMRRCRSRSDGYFPLLYLLGATGVHHVSNESTDPIMQALQVPTAAYPPSGC